MRAVVEQPIAKVIIASFIAGALAMVVVVGLAISSYIVVAFILLAEAPNKMNDKMNHYLVNIERDDYFKLDNRIGGVWVRAEATPRPRTRGQKSV